MYIILLNEKVHHKAIRAPPTPQCTCMGTVVICRWLDRLSTFSTYTQDLSNQKKLDFLFLLWLQNGRFGTQQELGCGKAMTTLLLDSLSLDLMCTNFNSPNINPQSNRGKEGCSSLILKTSKKKKDIFEKEASLVGAET